MKNALVGLLLFAVPTAFADQIRVVCHIDQTKAFVKVLKNDGEPAQVSLYENSKAIVNVDDKDVFELTQSFYRLNVVAAHHNTVIKISSDFDIFGGDISKEGEETWKGYVFLSPNLAQDFGGKSKHRVTCNYDI